MNRKDLNHVRDCFNRITTIMETLVNYNESTKEFQIEGGFVVQANKDGTARYRRFGGNHWDESPSMDECITGLYNAGYIPYILLPGSNRYIPVMPDRP